MIDRKIIVPLGFFAALLAIWQGASALQLWPSYIFPSPREVAVSMVDGFKDGAFPRAILGSFRRLAIGYGLSIVIGVPLGLLLGRARWAQRTIGTIVLGLQALPSICWLPMALLWFGLSDRSIVFVVIMGAVMAISLSTADGVKNTSPMFVRAANTLGAHGFFLYSRVVFPAALPAVLSGLKLGWTFAWRSLMAGELLYVTIGLGQLLAAGRELNDMSRVLSVMLLIIALGLAVDRLVFRPAEAYLRDRWGVT
jgi:NitT/TauT family transport system permease protein